MTTFPVIASTLSEKELGDFIKKRYELTDDYNCKLYRTGVNHTYFISKNETKLVLRVYCYQWRTKLEIEQELELLNLLRENSFSVSIPILDKKGNFIQEINGIPEAGASIYSFF
jgi:Ser/Thr protein kinase RdoA (MazF antagonist)